MLCVDENPSIQALERAQGHLKCTQWPRLDRPEPRLQAARGAHRCLYQRIQRQSRARRLDQEKGPSTPIQESPYHSALMPGTRHALLALVDEGSASTAIDWRVDRLAISSAYPVAQITRIMQLSLSPPAGLATLYRAQYEF